VSPAPPVDERPYPVHDPDSAPFWAATAGRRLVVPHCPRCVRLHYPPAPRCVRCLRPLDTWQEVSGHGTLRAWTTVHAGLVAGLEVPYVVAEVELDEQPGLVITSNLLGAGQPRVGDRVELQWSRPYPDGTRLPLFRPSGAPS